MLDSLQLAADERREQEFGLFVVLSCCGHGIGARAAPGRAGQVKAVAGGSS